MRDELTAASRLGGSPPQCCTIPAPLHALRPFAVRLPLIRNYNVGRAESRFLPSADIPLRFLVISTQPGPKLGH